jgi:hypothetical protein
MNVFVSFVASWPSDVFPVVDVQRFEEERGVGRAERESAIDADVEAMVAGHPLVVHA